MPDTNKIKILHLEDVSDDAELIERKLQKGNVIFDILVVDTRDEFEKSLKEFAPDIILSDHTLNGFNSMDALSIVKKSGINIPFVLVTGTMSEEFAVKVMREGASDYILKDHLDRLPEAISSALEKNHAENDTQVFLELQSSNEKKFRHTLNSMLVGVQIHDFNWNYIYVNDAYLNFSKYRKEELLGHTLMEIFPGMKQTPLFHAMQRCMQLRISEQLETEIVFTDGSCYYFEISIQPIAEGISVQSVDRSEQQKIKEKLIKANRLYAFISAINQSIVHINDEIYLLNNACKIAVDIGGFKTAWVGIAESEKSELKIISIAGDKVAVQQIQGNGFTNENNSLTEGTPSCKVFKSGQYIVSNFAQDDPELILWKKELTNHKIKSSISLPLFRFGHITGVVGFHSSNENFFDEEEINLLKEASRDLSFALENIENSRRLKNAEKLLALNEKRFRALIENGTDMISLSTKHGAMIYGSPSINKVFGYSAEEIQDSLVFNYIHPDDIDAYIEKRNVILKIPGASFYHQHRLLHKDGHWIWCEVTVTNMLEEPGINALVSNFRDISEKKKMEKQREFDKNNLNALINSTNDLMWSIDRDFNLITFNKPFEEIIKLATGTLLQKGNNILDSGFSTEWLQRYKMLCERAFAGESFTETEHGNFLTESWSEISYFPIWEGDKVIGTACHSRNITERKEAEQKLEHENNELSKANQELDFFVHSVSHDLRAPLNSVLGLTSLIQKESIEPSTLKYTGMIRESVNRLDDFVKNILNYSYNNRTILDVKIIAVQKAITEIVDSLKNMKDAEGIHFEIAIDKKQIFYSDRQRFNVIFENLISNAIKYHKKNVEGRFIKIKSTCDADELCIEITDNGIGIAPEYHDAIFDMFFRSPGNSEEGTGIGLYMVKEIVERLQGSISVKSSLGIGTTFSVMLHNFNTTLADATVK
ncbi:MAG: PAS domain S-box protein [Bacteroidota bacterium]